MSNNIPSSNMIIVIPSRLAATRLPNKPLADINGMPMILHVANRAKESNAAKVLIASGDIEINKIVEAAGFEAILTDPNIQTGTDRVFSAIEIYCKNNLDAQIDYVINLQGDLPYISSDTIKSVADLLRTDQYDITTAAAPFYDQEDAENPSIVKAIIAKNGRALYFSRSSCVPYTTQHEPYYHHVGIYGYKMSALRKFVSLERSPLEVRENLEQLRALEDGMSIGVSIVSDIPQSVDTPQDLEKVCKFKK